jgi:hypothetical protein
MSVLSRSHSQRHVSGVVPRAHRISRACDVSSSLIGQPCGAHVNAGVSDIESDGDGEQRGREIQPRSRSV